MKIKLSKEKIAKLKKEFKKLQKEIDEHHSSEHGTILESMKEAATNTVSIGTRTSRMKEIEWILKSCEELPEGVESNSAVLGSKVEVEVENGHKLHYKLVHPIEADPTKGYISIESPLGKLLLGIREGSTVEFNDRDFKVVSLS